MSQSKLKIIYLVKGYILFFALYTLTNLIAEYRDITSTYLLPIDSQLPFIPWTILFYISLYYLPVLLISKLKLYEVRAIFNSILVTAFLVFPIFLIFPAKFAFQRISPGTFPWDFIYSLLHSIDRPYNLLPSTHVILSGLFLLALARGKSKTKKVFYMSWMLAIHLSILTTWQHHVLDLLSGWLFTLFIYRFAYLKLLIRFS